MTGAPWRAWILATVIADAGFGKNPGWYRVTRDLPGWRSVSMGAATG